jgi:hypothetical protein
MESTPKPINTDHIQRTRKTITRNLFKITLVSSLAIMGVGCSGLEDDSVLANSASAVTGADDYLEFGDMTGSDEEDSEALALGEEDTDSNVQQDSDMPLGLGEEEIDSDEEEPEEPACKPFEPTSPPPESGPLPTPPQGACNFYLEVAVNPGGCSQEERTLIGGYHQTCTNVSTGLSISTTGANCRYQTDFRKYVDTFRYCLQEEVAFLSTTDGCLTPGTTCTNVVDSIRDAHSGCNDQTDFCGTMEDADAGYCFGYSIGDAWGAVGVGTLPGGPTAPLGVSGTLDSICACDDPVTVQRNICAGYRQGCADRYPLNTSQYLLCMASCPTPTIPPVFPVLSVFPVLVASALCGL